MPNAICRLSLGTVITGPAQPCASFPSGCYAPLPKGVSSCLGGMAKGSAIWFSIKLLWALPLVMLMDIRWWKKCMYVCVDILGYTE